MSGVYEFRPRRDEPVVLNPALAELVELARRQSPPQLQVSAEDLTGTWAQTQRRHGWMLGAMAVTAAGLLAAFLAVGPRIGTSVEPAIVADASPPSAQADRPPPATVGVAVPTTGAPQTEHGVGQEIERSDELVADELVDEPGAVPPGEGTGARGGLAPGVEIRPADAGHHPAAPGSVVVLSTWSVEVAAGSYQVVVPADATRPLEVSVHRKVLRVQPGSEVSVVAGSTPKSESSFDVQRGLAQWVQPKSRDRRASAADLARRADDQIASGRTKGAISTLQELLRRHPRSAAAKAATLDLARLQRAAGRRDAAACAYQTYLDRWPTSRLRRDVERNLEQLGGPRACRGLRPR